MKLNRKLIQELVRAGATYDEAVNIAMKQERSNRKHLNKERRRRKRENPHRRP